MFIWNGVRCCNSSSIKLSHYCRNYYFSKKPGLQYTSTSATEAKKTPFIEKWKTYWQDLASDYYEVLKDTIEDGRKNPKRSAFLFMCSTVAFTCFKTNPDEIDFRDNVIKCSNEISLVGKPIRNKSSEEFLTNMETYNNFGVIRRMSFGLFSVVWIDNFSNELGVYKANCSYLKPQYLTFLNRVVDIGFFGRWWRLSSVMKDYDVNSDEWINSDQVVTSVPK